MTITLGIIAYLLAGVLTTLVGVRRSTLNAEAWMGITLFWPLAVLLVAYYAMTDDGGVTGLLREYRDRYWERVRERTK